MSSLKSKREAGTAEQEHDPPPANVTSDLQGRPTTTYGLSKRRTRTPLELDEIETSEDELQAGHPAAALPSRPTNFSRIAPSPRSRARMRGDMTRTSFGRPLAGKERSRDSISISRAVSGKNTYSANGAEHQPVYLQQSTLQPTLFEAWSGGHADQDHSWLSFDTKDISAVHYGATYIGFRRSMRSGRPPILAVQFADADGASRVAQMIGGGLKESDTRENMQQRFEISWKNALHSFRPPPDEAPSAQLTTSSHGKEHRNTTTVRQSHDDDHAITRKLKDGMTAGPDTQRDRQRSLSPLRRSGVETRRTRRSMPAPLELEPVFDRWSEANAGWDQNWKQTLVYPATGRNRASVDKEDILRLDEGEFLNDNLISFYLRYLQTKMEKERPELVNRVHIFSTFFFEKLVSGKGGINYDGVKNWTSKLDVFSYDYIVVPVNENAHWYLAVICNTPKLLESVEEPPSTPQPTLDALGRPRPATPMMATVEREMSDISLEEVPTTRKSARQLSSAPGSSPGKAVQAVSSATLPAQGPRPPSRRLDSSQPRIVTLDSLGSNHTGTCKALKEYLVEEAKDKKHINLSMVPGGMKARGIPEQNNFCDCGIFVLGYMERFLSDPDGMVHKMLMKEHMDWSIDPVKLRSKVRNILFGLQKDQIERLAQEREEKRNRKRASKSSPGSVPEVIARAPKPDSTSKAGQSEYAPASPDTVKRSVTPPGLESRRSSHSGDARAVGDDEDAVDMVKMRLAYTPEVNPMGKTAQAVQPQREKAKSNNTQPSSSATVEGENVRDTQDSVQVVAVSPKPQAQVP